MCSINTNWGAMDLINASLYINGPIGTCCLQQTPHCYKDSLCFWGNSNCTNLYLYDYSFSFGKFKSIQILGTWKLEEIDKQMVCNYIVMIVKKWHGYEWQDNTRAVIKCLYIKSPRTPSRNIFSLLPQKIRIKQSRKNLIRQILPQVIHFTSDHQILCPHSLP